MTTEFMQVTLSQQPADARWGEKALLSTNGEGMTIHLTGADKLGAIQRAGRKIDGQGIKMSNSPATVGTWKTAGRFGRVTAGRKETQRRMGRTAGSRASGVG